MMQTCLESPIQSSKQEIDVLEQLDGLFRLDDRDAGEVVLIRHAEPAGRNTGADPLLSCTGLDQAGRLAEHLAAVGIECVYTAPERRALLTARVISDRTGSRLCTIEAISDIEHNAGATREDSARLFFIQPRWDSLPGFEPGRAFRRRVIQAIEALIASHPAARIAVVTHTAVINAYLSMLLSIPCDIFFAPDHASVSVVRHQHGAYAVRCLNDTAHIAEVADGPSINASLMGVNRLLNGGA